MRLRVAANATDEEIQAALYQLLNSNVQSTQGRQGNFETVRKGQAPFKSVLRTSFQLSHPLRF